MWPQSIAKSCPFSLNNINFKRLVARLFSLGVSERKQETTFHRKNGLSCPLDSLQVLAWFLTAAPCVLFFLVNFAFLNSTGRMFWTPLFLVPYVFGVGLFVVVTLSTHPLPEITSRDFGHMCPFCDDFVPNDAKHCRNCNKCRVGFDHHCRYINNCVTTSNYVPFFFGCCLLVCSSTVGMAGLVEAIIRHAHSGSPAPKAQASDYYGSEVSTVVFWVMIVVALAFDLGLSVPVSILIGYHMMFQANGITTYDYIRGSDHRFPQKIQKLCCKSRKVRKAWFSSIYSWSVCTEPTGVRAHVFSVSKAREQKWRWDGPVACSFSQ